MLRTVGLNDDDAAKHPHALSSGERQRVSLARALILSPQLLVCDEPVAALAVSIQARVLNLLAALQETRSLSYLFIAHDLALTRRIAHRTDVMLAGQIVESASPHRLFHEPFHPYTKALLASIPQPETPPRKLADPMLPASSVSASTCPYVDRCPVAIDRCAAERPKLEAIRSDHRVACFLAGTG